MAIPASLKLQFPVDIGRKPASPARVMPALLTHRWEPASPVMCTRRLMKRPTEQHGGAREVRDNPKTVDRSGVYIYNDVSRSVSDWAAIEFCGGIHWI